MYNKGNPVNLQWIDTDQKHLPSPRDHFLPEYLEKAKARLYKNEQIA